jgi:hypothetical protein
MSPQENKSNFIVYTFCPVTSPTDLMDHRLVLTLHTFYSIFTSKVTRKQLPGAILDFQFQPKFIRMVIIVNILSQYEIKMIYYVHDPVIKRQICNFSN